MKLTVSNTCAHLSGAERLTSGMVGKTLDVDFSTEWAELIKVLVFTNGAVTKDVLNPTETVIIPWEVLANANKAVRVGAYGYRIVDGEKVLAIPTIWCDLGRVVAGADPSGDPSATPTPDAVEQIEAELSDHEERIDRIEQGGGSGFNIHSLTPESNITNDDEMPFFDVTATSPRKITWSNIKAKLKAYFDTIYIGLNALASYATKLWVQQQGYGTYSKPSGGIPKADLASAVQDSLGRADTALQEHQSLEAYRTAATQDVIDNGKADAADVAAIEAKIPSAASSDNQLADKAFVNSTVGTNTAIFRGTFNSVAELEAYSGEKTNNDYAFVIVYDPAAPAEVLRYDRYKTDGTTWSFEFSLNNSSFTAAQWAAIQSGITSGDVDLIRTALQPSDLEDYALKSEIPTVPNNVSAFTNDANYLTLETLPIYDGGVE